VVDALVGLVNTDSAVSGGGGGGGHEQRLINSNMEWIKGRGEIVLSRAIDECHYRLRLQTFRDNEIRWCLDRLRTPSAFLWTPHSSF